VANLVDLKKFLEIWRIWWIFFLNPRNMENLVNIENPLRGAWAGPHPIFFLQVVTLECIFQLFFYCAEKDWLKRLTVRTQPWFSFLGGRGGFFSLSEFEAVLDVSVLCCAACVRNERNLFSFFCFLLFPLRASQQIAALRTHAFSPSLDRPFLARSSWSVSSSAPPPPARFTYVQRTLISVVRSR
jgi:hypothetical protein